MSMRVVTSLSACFVCAYGRRVATSSFPAASNPLGNLLLARSNPSASTARSFRSLQPTHETGIQKLLQDSPHADGRGTIVGVLDTGCDVAAAGMLKTSDGKPKYIDFIDCTGGGDVDTSKIVTCEVDCKEIIGLSGRRIRLGDWADDVSEFRVGAVRLYELLTNGQRARLKQERKAVFESLQHQAVADASRARATLSSKAVDDHDAMLKELDECAKNYEDAGPLLDVVTYKDLRGVWRVVVGTISLAPDCKSVDLTGAIPMAPFAHERQVGDLGFGTALSYVVQVYENGDIVSIVVDAGSHGTHVAGIVAAHFEDALERSGVAPGAQILACKIGDGRLDSAETGTGLVRAIIAAKEAGCDLINLSYGEPFFQCDIGRISEVFADAVRKWGMAVFTSAGNSGPALSTLGAPGHLSAAITVGAYISPAMMADQYSMLAQEAIEQEKEAIKAASYWFTSRGPTHDGWLPSLCAPGGAIAPIPRHTLQGKAQYHGTSMASPNACGVAACVLSALRQSGIEVGPIELRRALENSATPVEIADPHAQGKGLINAPAAFAYAIEHHGKPAQDLEFEVTTRAGARGIYLRDKVELAGPKVFPVIVKPLFQHASGPQRSEEELEAMLNLDLDVKLSSDSPWITTPESIVLTSGKNRPNSFNVRLDLGDLPSGLHFARVHGMDATDPSRGPLFSLPITVIIPHARNAPTNIDAHISESEDVQPIELPMNLPAGAPLRRFVVAPEGAEWAEVKLVTGALPKGPHTVIFHAVPSARGDVPYSKTEVKRILALQEHSEKVIRVPVRSGSTLEICMQLSYLSNPASVAFDAHIEFHSYGVRGPSPSSLNVLRMGAPDTFARLELDAPLRPERICPSAQLTHVQRTLRPSDAVVSPASQKLDALPPSDAQRRADANAVSTQIHQMILTYKFELSAGSTVMPRVASLHDQLYDSPLDSMLWRLENSETGELIGYGGAMHDARAVKLSKGKYTISLLLRHPSPSQLKALEDLPLMLRLELEKKLGLKIFPERGAASSGGFEKSGMENKERVLQRHGHIDLYVLAPSAEDMPSEVGPGDALLGTLSIDKNAKSVSSMPIVYEVPPKVRKKDTKEAVVDEEKSGEELVQEAMLDARIKVLATLRKKGNSSDAYDNLSQAALETNKSHLPLLLELLRNKAASKNNASSEHEDNDTASIEWKAQHVTKAVNDFLREGPVDTGALAQYWGVSHDDTIESSKEEKKRAKEMESQRKAVREALFTKARYLAPYQYGIDHISLIEPPLSDDASKSPFVSAVQEMKQWVSNPADVEENDRDTLSLILADYEISLGRPGAALAILRKRLKEQPASGTLEAKQVAKRCLAMYRALGWLHLVGNMEEVLAQRFPVTKRPL